MTAGQDALREAARLETARIYSQLCPEQPRSDTPEHELHGKRSDQTANVHDIRTARQRKGVA